MNVLSLFDGMSCGQQALNRSGFKIDNYFASEIDKYAIKVTMSNYPETIQLGTVVNVNGFDLPKIDLLIGGSPCQSFSFAGKRNGMSTKCETEILTLQHYLELKNECFEFEGQSYLFWEYIRLLNETKPKYFLLENVVMGEKWEKVLSRAIGVNGIHINSALVSAQNRKRIYWTNIGMRPGGLFGDLESIIKQPKDRGILLKDILEDEVDKKYFLSQKALDYVTNEERLQKGYTAIDGEKGIGLNASGTNNYTGTLISQSIKNEKSTTIDSSYYKGFGVRCGKCRQVVEGKVKTENEIICHSGQKRSANRPSIAKDKNAGGTGPLSRTDGKTYCLDHSSFANYIELKDVKAFQSINNENNYKKRIRKLTPVECERLQTVNDNYTNYVSDAQRYRMLGNGWTIDVICHIFNYMK